MSNAFKNEFATGNGGRLLRVPAGSFVMGSPDSEEGHRIWEQPRKIAFATDFFLGQFPVTQEEYAVGSGTNPTDHEVRDDAPVDSVNWDQAVEYCRALTDSDRAAGVLPSDWEYRLPTEAEWEYASRAGSAAMRHGPPDDVAWYVANADQKPHAVGQKLPNAWGFHDMLGNVWEWCQDWFWVANPCRSARGGSYFNSARVCRSAQRWGWNPRSRGRYSGFRLLAAPSGPLPLSPPIDDFPPVERPPSIYEALDAKDMDLALEIITADPTALESPDAIPPPLHSCIYADRPEMLQWLLDHGADIERREQDYGATPLQTAIVMRHKKIIKTLVQRGADTSGAAELAQRGLAGAFEDDPRLNRDGYREVFDLLKQLGIRS